MSDESKSEMVLEVAPSGAEPIQWMVFWADDESEAIGDDLVFENRDDAVAHAKDRAIATKGPVRIIAHEGDGHEAEEWVVDEWTPFYQPDQPKAVE